MHQPLSLLLLVTVLSWNAVALAQTAAPESSAPQVAPSEADARLAVQDCPPPPARSPRDGYEAGGFARLLFSKLMGKNEQLAPRPFTGESTASGLSVRVLAVWSSTRLKVLSLRIATPEGARPWEPGEVVVRDAAGQELARIPAWLSVPRLGSNESGVLVIELVDLPVPPGGSLHLEVLEQGGNRSVWLKVVE